MILTIILVEIVMAVNHQSAYRLPMIIAIIAHLVLITVLVVPFPAKHFHRVVQQRNETVVKASAIDSAIVEQQVAAIHAEQHRKQQAEQKRLQAVQRKAEQAVKKRRREEQRLLAIKKVQQQLKQKQLAEKRARQKKAQAAKQALQKKQQALQDKLLKQQMEKEHQALLAHEKQLQAAQMQGEIDRYRAQILEVIRNNWHPAKENATLYCVMVAHIAPGGVVTAVDILRSSEDVALDRSAEAAIYKSSPLPVPKDPALFNEFRHLRIKMSPQEIR